MVAPEKRPSGAKARELWDGLMYGLKLVPFSILALLGGQL